MSRIEYNAEYKCAIHTKGVVGSLAVIKKTTKDETINKNITNPKPTS